MFWIPVRNTESTFIAIFATPVTWLLFFPFLLWSGSLECKCGPAWFILAAVTGGSNRVPRSAFVQFFPILGGWMEPSTIFMGACTGQKGWWIFPPCYVEITLLGMVFLEKNGHPYVSWYHACPSNDIFKVRWARLWTTLASTPWQLRDFWVLLPWVLSDWRWDKVRNVGKDGYIWIYCPETVSMAIWKVYIYVYIEIPCDGLLGGWWGGYKDSSYVMC